MQLQAAAGRQTRPSIHAGELPYKIAIALVAVLVLLTAM